MHIKRLGGSIDIDVTEETVIAFGIPFIPTLDITLKNLKIINIWTVFIIIFATDVYFERFFGVT